MSACQQAKAARRKAKTDARYQHNRKDAATRAERMRRQVANENARKARKKAA